VRLQGIIETCLYVEDLAAARLFYRRVLDLQEYSAVSDRHVFFRCGRGMLLLFNPEKTRILGGSVPAHGAIGAGHAAFAIADEHLAKWRDQLEREECPIEMEVEWPGGGRSLYFRDPDGNSLELTTPATWGLDVKA
jgi:catechol 2,3-dioxygenase-like lactoylglutathione lyase family enzyme